MRFNRIILVLLLIVFANGQKRLLEEKLKDELAFRGLCGAYIGLVKDYSCVRELYIGQGTNSTAFLIKDEKDKLYIMKVQTKSSQSLYESKMMDMLKGEKYIIQKISETFSDDIHILVLHFVERKTLETVISTTDYFSDVFKIFDFFKKLIEGLKNIHKHNFVHSNISITNILVTENYEPVITGLNSLVKENSLHNFRGTPVFMSPEIILGMNLREKIKYTRSVDIYAAGIVLYFIKMHMYPFESYQLRYSTLINTPIIFKENSSTLFMNLVLRCIQMEENVIEEDRLLKYMERSITADHEFPLVNSYSFTMKENKLELFIDNEEANNKKILFLMIFGVVIISLGVLFCFCQLFLFFIWSKTSKNHMSARPSEMNIDTTFIDSVNVSRVQ